jgi:hypothetical protein
LTGHRYSQTAEALAAISDEGLFERLATAVLRAAKPELYGNLTHPGINPDGRTIKGPLDGVSFVAGAHPRHLVAVHHTITTSDGLKAKWLRDPQTIKPRKRSRSVAYPGDLIKTIAIVKEERATTPDMHATLALTTTTEPREDVTRGAAALAHTHNIDLDVWTRERIAHFLDTTPSGQWLRREFLGLEQQRLSIELLRELSDRNRQLHTPQLDERTIVLRPSLRTIPTELARPLAFLLGESGYGKTTASLGLLAEHVRAGGIGLILTADIVASSLTADLAVDNALRQLLPNLAIGSGSEALAFSSNVGPLLLIIEDVNRASDTAALIERLLRWGSSTPASDARLECGWQVVCPLWPQLLNRLSEPTRKLVEAASTTIGPFTGPEAIAAIERRAALSGRTISPLEVSASAVALGYDPLLIALYDLDETPDAGSAVHQYVAGCTSRCALAGGTLVAQDYQVALRTLSTRMLREKTLDPSWDTVLQWTRDSGELSALRGLVKQGELIRLSSIHSDARLVFRHDRVRLWLLVNSAVTLFRQNEMRDDVFGEPFFAEVIGRALSDPTLPTAWAEAARTNSPLSLFFALQSFREPSAPIHLATIEAIENWLSAAGAHDRASQSVAWAALGVLAETDSSLVLGIVDKFQRRGWAEILARFRNGDLRAGLRLCRAVDPGSNAPWRDGQIKHVLMRFRVEMVEGLRSVLGQASTSEDDRVGALRFAGHTADSTLDEAIAESWSHDSARKDRLPDYLWAAANCFSGEDNQVLDSICDEWAGLSDEKDQHGMSARNVVAAYELRFAFQRILPDAAVRYFIGRAHQPELRWNITHMLDGVDHPDAVAFIAEEMASRARETEGSGGFWPFMSAVTDQWTRRKETGMPMSAASKNRLYAVWSDPTGDRHLRQQAFRIWAAGADRADMSRVRDDDQVHFLKDDILRFRLRLGDRTAIPLMVARLREDHRDYWLQYGRYLWSDELTSVLDERLAWHALSSWDGSPNNSDWIEAEMLTRLPAEVSEVLLAKHWTRLQYSPEFLQAALFASTSTTRELVRQTMEVCPHKKRMFQFVNHHFGVNTSGHPGVTRLEQLEGLLPYLDLIDEMAVYDFWTLCNRRGWIPFRQQHLDARLGEWRKRTAIDDETLFAALDDENSRAHPHWMDHHIETWLGQARSLGDIFSVIERWLRKQKGSTTAMELVAAAIAHFGDRSDVDVLKSGNDGSREAAEIISDTRFAVALRTTS